VNATVESSHQSMSINQVVAFNLMRARRRKGWTQDEAAERLTEAMNRKWTNATLSAAERSWQSGRTREFNADELAAFAYVFGVPLVEFFAPPDDGDGDAVYIASPDRTGSAAARFNRDELAAITEPSSADCPIEALATLLAETSANLSAYIDRQVTAELRSRGYDR
jgi:transcriptional regulator with XRE-family HTH domain